MRGGGTGVGELRRGELDEREEKNLEKGGSKYKQGIERRRKGRGNGRNMEEGGGKGRKEEEKGGRRRKREKGRGKGRKEDEKGGRRMKREEGG